MNYSKNANNKKTKKKKRNLVWTLLLRLVMICVIIGCFALGGAFLGAYMGIIETAPQINVTDAIPQNYTSILYDQNGTEIDRLHGDENRVYAKLSSIPIDLQNAVVAIEDERFYEHSGIDMQGIARALVENIKTMDITQGASTITQQLMKNEVLTFEQTLQRKIQEQYLALNFESDLEESLGSKKAAKDYILELYLNSIALNHGLNGVQAAAEFYFGKDVSELTLAESASIAGITKNPTAYSPLSQPENNKERQTLVLNKMLELEYITQDEYNTAINEDIYLTIANHKAVTDEDSGVANHSYFVDAAIVALAEQLQEERQMTTQQAYDLIYSGGLQVYLTVDQNMQDIMEASFAKDNLFPPSGDTYTISYKISIMDNETEKQSHYERTTEITSDSEIQPFVDSVKAELLNDTNTLVVDNVTVARSLQAAMVITDHSNGQVKALVGGREKTGDLVFNRATQALRQPGSVFKVLAAFAPGIDLGIMWPGYVIDDAPFTYQGWTPKNWWGSSYRGPSTVREGVYNSMNVVATKAYLEVGIDTAFNYLENFGFTTLVDNRVTESGAVETDRVASLALGGLTDGVTVLETAAAFGAIANDGVYIEPTFYTKVLDHEGNVLIDNTAPSSHRVIKETTAYLLTDMMEDVLTRGTGTLARFSNISMPIAGKTGTTTADKDLTFAAYSPYYSSSIWMGYDQPKSMSYSVSYHLLLWKDVMEQIHADLPYADFVQPDGIITMSACSVSGHIPTEFCSHDYYGGTVTSDIAAYDTIGANEYCDVHKQVTICEDSLMAPGPNCTEDSLISVYLALDENNNVINAPAEGGINLHETCNLDHEEDHDFGSSGNDQFFDSNDIEYPSDQFFSDDYFQQFETGGLPGSN